MIDLEKTTKLVKRSDGRTKMYCFNKEGKLLTVVFDSTNNIVEIALNTKITYMK